MAYRLILTAAGKGERLGHSLPKALVPLADGVPMVAYTLRRFTQIPLKGPALITAPPDQVEMFHSVLQSFAWPWAVQLIPGGNTRQESVRRALETLSDPEDIVCIHDAARPFIEADTVLACLNDAKQYGAATVAVPSADTILESSPDGFLHNTPDRAGLWQCQTPQCFRLELIRKAHQEAERQQWSATDDATLVWRTGHPVRLVPGTRGNFKVTTPDDLLVARVLAQGTTENACMYRIGIGWDLHRLEAGRPFILGGARIPHDRGAVAHSDGDTLVHAVIDALLGGAGLGNIGLLYPDTDPAYRGADSMTLLRDTVGRLRGAGWVPVNVDTVVVAQRPALNPHLDTIRRNIADALGISIESVSVKPKTAEKVGPEGREEAVSAQAIILLQKRGG